MKYQFEIHPTIISPKMFGDKVRRSRLMTAMHNRKSFASVCKFDADFIVKLLGRSINSLLSIGFSHGAPQPLVNDMLMKYGEANGVQIPEDVSVVAAQKLWREVNFNCYAMGFANDKTYAKGKSSTGM